MSEQTVQFSEKSDQDVGCLEYEGADHQGLAQQPGQRGELGTHIRELGQNADKSFALKMDLICII